MTSTDVPNAFYRASVKALVLNEQNEFLLAKEQNGFWELLGGGLDFGEDPRACLEREIREETGLQTIYISENPAYFITDQARNGTWIANVIYEVTLRDLEFTPSSECVELGFFDKERLKDIQVFTNVTKFAELFGK